MRGCFLSLRMDVGSGIKKFDIIFPMHIIDEPMERLWVRTLKTK